MPGGRLQASKPLSVVFDMALGSVRGSASSISLCPLAHSVHRDAVTAAAVTVTV